MYQFLMALAGKVDFILSLLTPMSERWLKEQRIKASYVGDNR